MNATDLLLTFPGEVWFLLKEMAPYLLLGFLIAGMLHVMIPQSGVMKHLSTGDTSAVTKAALVGVPLPLCSCGVIPVAAHLEKQGANRGPILSFLISTPTTGVDSILATYGLLGPLLAIARPVAALFNGIFTGVLVNRDSGKAVLPETASKSAGTVADHSGKSISQKARIAMRYAFVDLIDDTARWLVIGILAGAVISTLVPASVIENYLGSAWIAYPAMILVGIPMYVCATGSIPIAASLIMKGMSPGAGFIFLFAGPATNTATISFVGGTMGKRVLAIYVGTILVCSLIFGALIDAIWLYAGSPALLVGGPMEMLPSWLGISSAIGLTVLLMWSFVQPWFGKTPHESDLDLMVSDMNCDHCRRTIEDVLTGVEDVEEVYVNLEERRVRVNGAAKRSQVVTAIENAGYHVEDETL